MNIRTGFLLASAALLGGVSAAAAPVQQPVAPEKTLSPAEAKLAAVIERFNSKRESVLTAYRAAKTDDEKGKILAGMPGKDFIPDFRAVAEEAAGTDTAARAWMWVLRLASDDPKQSWEVIQLLLADHMQSAAIAELPGQMRYSATAAQVTEALRAMVAESPHDKVRASALFTLGSMLLDSKQAAARTEGRDCLEAVVTEYGALAYGSGSTYKAAAEGFLYDLDHLQLGMAAPDFQTVDENGAPWKLSDYKGKVVVVDFWGFW